MYILAIPSSVKRNSRGYPEVLSLKDFEISENDKEKLRQFCKDYNLCPTGNMEWYLSSYWG